jgi:hypothetical protein
VVFVRLSHDELAFNQLLAQVAMMSTMATSL